MANIMSTEALPSAADCNDTTTCECSVAAATTTVTTVDPTLCCGDADSGHGAYVAPFVPTCQIAQTKALEILALTPDDVLFDLGCGDARLLLESVKQTKGIRAIGIEIRPLYVERAKSAILAGTVDDIEPRSRIDVRLGNMTDMSQAIESSPKSTCCESDLPTVPTPCPHVIMPSSSRIYESSIGQDCQGLSLLNDATAVYLFLVPKALVQIQPILDELLHQRVTVQRRSIRFVAYMFRIRKWEPTSVERVTNAQCPIYLYRFHPIMPSDSPETSQDLVHPIISQNSM